MSESHVQLAERIYDLFGKGDIPAVLALFDEHIEWREAEGHPYRPSGAPLVGPQAILTDLFMRLGQDWDGLSVTPASLLPTPEGVLAQGRSKGTCKATGRSLDAQFAHVLTMRDGKLVGFQQYIDTAQLQAVMGRGAD
jgi:uncharacterized protein